MSTTADKNFRIWLAKVDAVIGRICGLSHSDLADQCWRDWFEDGVTPAQAAKRCLAEEGFEL